MTKVILFYNGVTIKSAANRSMLEQTWGEFAQLLTYKAEGAGMSVVRVDPAYTSLTCSRWEWLNSMHRRQERNRIRFRCPDCGNDLNRSVNAAKNILVRGLAQPVSLCGRISRSQDGPVWKNQRRRYPASVRKTALVRSVAP